MDSFSSSSSSLQIFGSSETFTLIVGPEKEKLYISRYVVERIPFLRAAMQNEEFKEGKEKLIQLPEEEAKYVADVVWYVMVGEVPELEKETSAQDYIKAFIVADRFVVEQVANQLIDALVDGYTRFAVEPEHLTLLSTAGLQSTSFYRVIVEELAHRLRSHGESRTRGWSQLLPEVEGAFVGLCSSILFAVLKAAVTPRGYLESPAEHARKDLCSLHTHQVTPKCADEDEDEDEAFV